MTVPFRNRTTDSKPGSRIMSHLSRKAGAPARSAPPDPPFGMVGYLGAPALRASRRGERRRGGAARAQRRKLQLWRPLMSPYLRPVREYSSTRASNHTGGGPTCVTRRRPAGARAAACRRCASDPACFRPLRWRLRHHGDRHGRRSPACAPLRRGPLQPRREGEFSASTKLRGGSLPSQDTRKRVVGVLLGETHKGRLDVTNSYAGAPSAVVASCLRPFARP